MSKAGVEFAIWEMHRDGRGADFRDDAESYLDEVSGRVDIGPEERDALLARDYRGLMERGIHPMAVLFFSQVNQLPMPFYLEAIGAAPERVDEFKRVFRAMHGDG